MDQWAPQAGPQTDAIRAARSFLLGRADDAEQLARRIVTAYFKVTDPNADVRPVMASVPPEKADKIAAAINRRT